MLLPQTTVCLKTLYKAIKVRIYPTSEQSQKLSQIMGAARWWWNYALNLCNETYKETGKGLTQIALNKVLRELKKIRGYCMVRRMLFSSFAINYFKPN
ncbi:hypothetical protein NIES593_22675 [Hydrococcus rivularis NIES-593]|uniref:Transposase putative helix-turn-helix domain-containing protein n=1 Tax=Hydrococcus rivularis NIES-593 TaxID=1921803 RepID=A0A1U7H7A7_9CYAN|nr:helix-turn-helix domain-containing protein [Hydrococcus rivularis]OKH17931.1 hypothetical protein NIES593_22675 [Hydrococcus rivularis NIES-593]